MPYKTPTGSVSIPRYANRFTNSSAASATSRQPLSITSAWPRFGQLRELRHAGVVLLALVGRVRDRMGHGVVLLAGDEQQRPPLGVLGVGLHLGPRVQVRHRGLEQRLARRGDHVAVEQLARLGLLERVRPAVAELVERQRDRLAAVERVAEHGERGRAAPRSAAAARRGRALGRSRPRPRRARAPRRSAPSARRTSGRPQRASSRAGRSASATWSATCATPLPANASGLARAASTLAGSSGQSTETGA